jgi:MFS family permease
LGQLSLIFVIFALPSGYIGGRFGRRRTIITGLLLMTLVILSIFLLPAATLTLQLTKLPVLGVVPVIGVLLMVAGAAWALININSLPMVVDMTDAARLGTYTGLYYLFSTLAAIAGPNVNGWIIQLTGRNYNSTMMIAPLFLLAALFLMVGVRRGEARLPGELESRLSESGVVPG